jgi:hypothetical protein
VELGKLLVCARLLLLQSGGTSVKNSICFRKPRKSRHGGGVLEEAIFRAKSFPNDDDSPIAKVAFEQCLLCSKDWRYLLNVY